MSEPIIETFNVSAEDIKKEALEIDQRTNSLPGLSFEKWEEIIPHIEYDHDLIHELWKVVFYQAKRIDALVDELGKMKNGS